MKPTREAGGFQIAFFTLAANFVAIPISKSLATWLHLMEFQALLSRALTLFIGVAVILSFPALRRTAWGYLKKPLLSSRRSELITVIAFDIAVISLAIAGGLAVWSWAQQGNEGLKYTFSDEAQMARALSAQGITFLILAVVVAPITEEIVFRGFMLHAWQRRFGCTVSAILTSTMFALYHPYFVIAFLQSLILICVLRRTGSLRGAIILHTCANLSLWYPLLGRFIFPYNPQGAISPWLPHFFSLALAGFLMPWYIWLAWSDKKTKFAQSGFPLLSHGDAPTMGSPPCKTGIAPNRPEDV